MILFVNLLCVLLTYMIKLWISQCCLFEFNEVYAQQEKSQYQYTMYNRIWSIHFQEWKIKKRGWKYSARAGFLEWGGYHFSYLMFSRFIIFTCRNFFTLCRTAICIWRKNFYCHLIFMKKSHSKFSSCLKRTWKYPIN